MLSNWNKSLYDLYRFTYTFLSFFIVVVKLLSFLIILVDLFLTNDIINYYFL